MSKIKKIIYIVLLVFLHFYCRNSQTAKNLFTQFDTREILGAWKIIPSYNSKIVFEKNEKNFLISEKGKVEIFAFEDKRGLRLYHRLEDESPFAYFLFSERTKNIWGGVLENKVIRIVREEQIPESILE